MGEKKLTATRSSGSIGGRWMVRLDVCSGLFQLFLILKGSTVDFIQKCSLEYLDGLTSVKDVNPSRFLNCVGYV